MGSRVQYSVPWGAQYSTVYLGEHLLLQHQLRQGVAYLGLGLVPPLHLDIVSDVLVQVVGAVEDVVVQLVLNHLVHNRTQTI